MRTLWPHALPPSDITGLLLRVYVLSGVLAAIAGMVVMSRANSAKADYGSSYLLLAVLIAVLGGVNPYGGYGKITGVVLAVLAMQFLSSGLNMLSVSNFARELIWGVLLILRDDPEHPISPSPQTET